MEVVSIVDDIEYLNDNQVIGNLKLDNASIEFKGNWIEMILISIYNIYGGMEEKNDS